MPRIRKDITGQRFGRLLVVGTGAEKSQYGLPKWLCRCDCGKEKEFIKGGLTNGSTKSCGCLNREMTIAKNLKHGMTGSKEYEAYSHAKSRCHRKNDPRYKNYGARGIKMCKEWRNSFQSFLKHMGLCPEGLSLDRINNDIGYQPGNCRWANDYQQRRNRTDNVWITYNGETMIAADWARKFNFDIPQFCRHMRNKNNSIEAFLNRRKWSKREIQ